MEDKIDEAYFSIFNFRSSGSDPKEVLDKALFAQMQALAQRKKDLIKVMDYRVFQFATRGQCIKGKKLDCFEHNHIFCFKFQCASIVVLLCTAIWWKSKNAVVHLKMEWRGLYCESARKKFLSILHSDLL